MALRVLLAAVSGVLFAFSFPNVAAGWLIFIAPLPLFLAVVRAKSAREAAFNGWVSQTTAWLLMVPWVVRVMSHYGGLPYAAGVAIFVAMSAMLGLYGGVFALIAYRIRPAESFRRWLFLPLAWAAIEYARTYLITGFPWNLAATAIIDYTALIQIDRFAGPYLVVMLIFLPATAGAWMWTARPAQMHAFLVGSAVAIVCFVWWVTGVVGSKLIARTTQGGTHVAAMLQPNISQEMRWDETNLMDIFQRMMRLTDEAAAHGASVIVWPESTVPLSYSRTAFYRGAVEGASVQHSADIILGSVAEDPENNRLWNAAFLVSSGKTVGHYDKIRLVPFGEYVPLRKMLFFAKKLVRAVGDFQFGTNDKPLAGKHRYGLAICYEIVFPQIGRSQVKNGAEVLVTITNDAWYDGTSAPRQHLNMARLRAVETDRYLLRAGTTGISAFVDPTGRIVSELPMNRQGIVYATFQPRHTTTPYVRFGDWFAWLACIGTAAALLRKRT